MDINRTLIIKSIKLLKNFPNLCGDNLNIQTFSDFISNRYNEPRQRVIKMQDSLKQNRSSVELMDICEWFIFQYFEPNSGLHEKCAYLRLKVEDLASNGYLSRILTPVASDTNLLNFDEHLANGDVVIINTKNTILGYLGKTFGEFLMLSYMNSVFRRNYYQKERKLEYVKPNFLYIDEFATFSPVVLDLFTQGRSFRIGTHIVVQNRTLLGMCGEEDTRNQAFIMESNTRNLVLFPGLNGEDADYYSKQFFNLKPSEILYRPFGQIVYRIIQNKTIMPPAIGLVFFIDEIPNTNSLKHEFKFDDDGDIVYSNVKD